MTDQSIPVLDNMHAPDIFVHEIGGVSFVDGVAHLTLLVGKWAQPAPGGQLHKVVIARLIMSEYALQNMVVGLHDLLMRQGLDPSKLAVGGAVKN